MTYELIDSGDGLKWEKFGPYLLERPCPQAIWRPRLRDLCADAVFNREERWRFAKRLPDVWEMTLEGVVLKVALTDFGHVGAFPEHATLWPWMHKRIRPEAEILNLFAYSGGATLYAARLGAAVCHVDASKGMVDWARDNARRNGLDKAKIRWIVDDAVKFLKREAKRGKMYDGIILDPPTFGRGNKGEVFKIEETLLILLDLCRELLAKRGAFLILTCHTPGITPRVLQNVLGDKAEAGELLLTGKQALSIPSGSYGRIDV